MLHILNLTSISYSFLNIRRKVLKFNKFDEKRAITPIRVIKCDEKCASTVTEKNAMKNIFDGRTEVKQYTPLPLRGAGV
jgi:hypothetical protein